MPAVCYLFCIAFAGTNSDDVKAVATKHGVEMTVIVKELDWKKKTATLFITLRYVEKTPRMQIERAGLFNVGFYSKNGEPLPSKGYRFLFDKYEEMKKKGQFATSIEIELPPRPQASALSVELGISELMTKKLALPEKIGKK